MQNIKNYISQLSKRDYILLIFSISLLLFVIIKFFLIDGLTEKNLKLNKKSTLITQQENIITNLNGNTFNTVTGSKSSNQLINNFLSQNSASKSLKQIRTMNDGARRFEIEDIDFTTLVKLLNSLELNSISYNSLQIKKTKKDGVVDAVMTIP